MVVVVVCVCVLYVCLDGRERERAGEKEGERVCATDVTVRRCIDVYLRRV